MFKIIWLLKRKAGMTPAQFREHFERSHAPMAQKYVGHLLSEYRRNYLSEFRFDVEARTDGFAYEAREWTWDLLSEWVMPSEEAFNEVMRIMTEPRIAAEFREDSSKFSEQVSTVMLRGEVVDTGAREGHLAPRRKRT